MISAKLEYPLRLRPHHLICLQLFQGRGYDEAFTARMQAVYDLMTEQPETRFVIAGGADDICAMCPNRAGDNTCALGDGDVAERDRNALEALGLRAGDAVSFAVIRARTAERVDEAAFIRVCGGMRITSPASLQAGAQLCAPSDASFRPSRPLRCRWEEEGVCTFRGLTAF